MRSGFIGHTKCDSLGVYFAGITGLYLLYTKALYPALALGLAFAPAWVAAETPSIELVDYTITRGDTCTGVAERFYGDGRRWDVVHEFNPQLGPSLPHRLIEGEVLRLPPRLPPSAWVTRVVRTVEHRTAAVGTWSPSPVGQPLDVGYRVATRDASAARLTFRDDSALDLRQNTLVVIFGRTSGQVDARPNRARLERGTLRSRLAALRGQSDGIEVQSASAVAHFGAGDALMAMDEGAAAVSNHEGGAVRVASADRSAAVAVDPGMGTRVERGRAPMKPRPLPEPPVWVDARAQAAWGATAEVAVAEVEWGAVAGARSYRIDIDGGGALVAGADLPPSQTRLALTGLSAGTWQVRVSVTDGDALSSRPSAPISIRVAALPAAGAELSVGTLIRGCGPLDDPDAPEVSAATVGPLSVRCGDETRTLSVVP